MVTFLFLLCVPTKNEASDPPDLPRQTVIESNASISRRRLKYMGEPVMAAKRPRQHTFGDAYFVLCI